MKNRLLAMILIIVVCCSIFTPMTVYAATTTTSASQITWTKTTINGDIYQISYYHPIGLDKYYILQNNNSTKVIFYNDEVSTVDDDYRYGVGEFVIFCIGKGVGYPGRDFNAQLAICRDLLYNEESEWRASTSSSTASNIANSVVWYMTSEDGSTLALTQGAYEKTGYGEQHKDINISNSFLSMEDSYSTWYVAKYSNYPPLAKDIVGETEYMIGSYYAIFQQPIEKTGTITEGGGATRPEDGSTDLEVETNIIKTKGYVDTIEKTNVYSKDGVYTYVVISSEEPTGDIISSAPHDFSLKGMVADILLMLESRNFYYYAAHDDSIFYDKTANLNRYYFSSLNDACKFVLYGTTGAMYDYKEIGLTNFGYGYTDCMYNNYDIRFYPKTPIPVDTFPLKRGQILLRWHNANVYDREYLLIDFNYFPYAAMLTSNYSLMISEELEANYKVAFKIEDENYDTFDPFDFTQYKEPAHDRYTDDNIEHFQIYYDDIDELLVNQSWDIIYSTITRFYQITPIYDENGNVIGGGIEGIEIDKPSIEVLEKDGHKVLYDSVNDEYHLPGQEDGYKKDPETGKYLNPDGEEFDPSGYLSPTDEWQKGLEEYMTDLSKVSYILDEMTGIVNDMSKTVKPLTSLLNKVFSELPSFYRTAIIFLIFALIIRRIASRGSD